MAVRIRLPRQNKTTSLRAAWAPSLLRKLLRHRAVWLVVLLAVASGSSLQVMATIAAVDAERDRWGSSEMFVVVTDEIAVGDFITGNAELRLLPAALVPPGSIRQIPAEAVAKVALHPGETILAERIAGSSRGQIPAGTVAMTLPVTTQVPLLQQGSLVDLWAIDSANFSSRRIAASVVVLAFGQGDVTVAVPTDQVSEATVASLRPVTVTIIG